MKKIQQQRDVEWWRKIQEMHYDDTSQMTGAPMMAKSSDTSAENL